MHFVLVHLRERALGKQNLVAKPANFHNQETSEASIPLPVSCGALTGRALIECRTRYWHETKKGALPASIGARAGYLEQAVGMDTIFWMRFGELSLKPS